MAKRNKKCPDCEEMILEYSNKCRSCAKKGRVPWNKGIPNTWYNPKGLEIGWKLQKRFVKGQVAPMKDRPNLKTRGENHWRWKGGIGSIRHILSGRLEYKQWRTSVFEKDNYTCQICGQNNTYLHADHINGWAEYPEQRYLEENGRTLCRKCHYFITFGKNMKGESKWAFK